MIFPPTVVPLWGSEIQPEPRSLRETFKICPPRRVRMIVPPTVGPLWGSEIQPEPRSWGETSGEYYNLSETSRLDDFQAYCWPSLGLGNTAEADVVDVVNVVNVCIYVHVEIL